MEENLLSGEGAQALPFFLLFMLSQWGWWCFFGKHSSADILFLPSLTACFQITFLVCAGIGGFLLYGTYGLFLFGIVYLLYAFVRKGHPLKMISAVEVLFLLCMTVLIYRAVDGKILSHADDFHHGGVGLKELLLMACFPGRSRYLTMHFAYPLGSAVWIYHVCRSLSACSESVWMFAQALLMPYCMLPLFAFFPKRVDCAASRIYAALYFLFTVIVENCILSYNVEIYTLLVDSLLPLVGVAASMFALFADGSREMQKPKTEANILCLAAYLSALIQIKTSGVLFAIAAVLILVLKRSIRTDRRRVILTGGVLAASFMPLMLWKLYCAKHFAGMSAKHEGSISSFIRLFSEKSPADMENICYGSMKYFLTSSNLIEMVAVLAAVFAIAMVLTNDSDIVIAAKCWMYMLVVYLVYSIFTTAMYVFSMPLREALYLASNFRYQKTMLIYCYYVLFATLLYAVSKAKFVVMRTDGMPQKAAEGGKEASQQKERGGWVFLSVQPKEENPDSPHADCFNAHRAFAACWRMEGYPPGALHDNGQQLWRIFAGAADVL